MIPMPGKIGRPVGVRYISHEAENGERVANKRVYSSTSGVYSIETSEARRRPAPTVDISGFSASAWGYGSILSLNSFSVPSGTDRLLVVATEATGYPLSVISMTFTLAAGSQESMTRAGRVDAGYGISEIWYLPLGNSVTPTLGDISISFNGSGVQAAAIATPFSAES
jgi:hypothetical protein